MMKETEVIIKNNGTKLYGVLHTPSRQTKSVIIFANGYPDNLVEGHLIISSARYFCKNGYAFLRVNPRGRPPSSGKLTHVGLFDMINDLENIVDFLKKNCYDKIGLIGHSLGGLSAILMNSESLNAISLWEPSSVKVLNNFLAKTGMATQFKKHRYAVDEESGFVVGRKLFDDLKKITNISQDFKKINSPILIIAGSKLLTPTAKLYFKYANEPKSLKIIKNARHTFDNQKHEDMLFKYTYDWFHKWI